ncbi:SMP-30/gluconolactonase/LRE family protein [Paenibacillus psychroresistens]|uniref:SMP-30/gluconolactonase/LRE family protein n=1 Tax=Paenibacillus psychroresistens TaxID=1778678 RepID=A0A6B8REZ5_9BACL|nr:SMP-30/gluconolactonase/LRE family protein [Paenibacillus psychroresistens]QGQ94294.1 SMP-30/gluconolactonase/LRE family protein [Paenibacillus psychroresistens]
MENYEIIADFTYLCGESPIWDEVKQQFWWTDMLTGKLYVYEPQSGSVKQAAEGPNVSGFTMNKRGGLVCATHQGLYLWDEFNGFQLIADQFEGNRLRSNDATADAAGRFLFGTTFYGPDSAEYPLGKLYKVEKDGSISILDEDIHLSNGLGFSPDNKTLYYTDTVLRVIYAYDYDLQQGTVSNRRVFVQVPEHEGIPDGLTVDAEGFVWSAQWYGGCLVRYNPQGQVDQVLQVPAKQTSSVIFGGADLTDIYVTTAGLSVTLPVAPQGYDFHAADIGGPVYRYNLGIKGKPEYAADITK